MIKKIPCIIVSSKPLDKGGNALRYVSPVRSPWASYRSGAYWFTSNGVSASHNFPHKIKGIAQDKYAGHPVTYTRLLEITSESMDDGQTARVLDCYV
jgi:hypothetical protein